MASAKAVPGAARHPFTDRGLSRPFSGPNPMAPQNLSLQNRTQQGLGSTYCRLSSHAVPFTTYVEQAGIRAGGGTGTRSCPGILQARALDERAVRRILSRCGVSD